MNKHKCVLCGYISSLRGFGSHLLRKHNIQSVQQYYDKYLKKENEGCCIICGNDTTFISLNKGYRLYCSSFCSHQDLAVIEKQVTSYKSRPLNQKLDTINRTKQTKKKRYGNENYNNQEKYRKTCKERYNIDYYLASPECIEKRKNTCIKIYGVDNPSKSSDIIERIRKTNQEHYEVDWVQQCPKIRQKTEHWWTINHGDSNPFKTTHFKSEAKLTKKLKYNDENYNNREQAKNTCFSKYGVANCMQSPDIRRLRHSHYSYNNINFDSSWELAVWIYCQDHNIPIVREPIALPYYKNNKRHYYYPDFLIDTTFVEIKGDQYFDETGKLKDSYKEQCIKEYDIKLWSSPELKPFLMYCINKFGSKHWFKQFKYKEVS